MTNRSPKETPPAFMTKILRAVLPRGVVGTSILGDLLEEYNRRSPRTRGLWYTLEVIRLIAVYTGKAFNLENLDRGTHALQLQISHTKSGEVYKSSPVVNFTILRYSEFKRKTPKAN